MGPKKLSDGLPTITWVKNLEKLSPKNQKRHKQMDMNA